jgi:hypothetical protein
MLSSKEIEESLALGNSQAVRVLSVRDEKLKQRTSATFHKSLSPRGGGLPGFLNADLAAALGPSPTQVIIAEGDSWFDYPRNDILNILEDHYGFDVESCAHKGDNVEDMAYTDGQLENFSRRIEKVLRRNSAPPAAILLSGGGNDIAGAEFKMLLNHRASPIGGLNTKVVEGIINERVMTSYITIIQAITSICLNRTSKTIPIIIHGYDYPIPDGRGFLGGFSILPGPWFEPGFRLKGFESLQERIIHTSSLIDSFNSMLMSLSRIPSFGHVRFVDLRGTLSGVTHNEQYKDDWANELHPSQLGFEKITEKIYQALI